jgi:hypothetical protein
LRVQLSPFRRRSAAPTTDVEEVDAEAVSPTRNRSHTPSKRELGLSTPKRKETGRRVAAPPKDRKEAAQQRKERQKELRDKQRAHRAEVREGMLAGKEEYLPARDKGPERALVRDVVDARRNLASYFLPAAFLVIIGSSAAMPPAVRLAVELFWVLLAVAIVLDTVLLTRRVRKALLRRFPKATKPTRSYYLYAIFRSLQIRRLRMPAAKVAIGTKIDV